ncbi:ABC transporter substrate-binding protein [Clostridium sp. CM028]|uniref:ABC transporter substrate-binding protein n=1 Tax=Clostridium sp. CM028 TaxID=2851575 RepID=UPI001C6E8826|nr:MetQ/NlpA family ABC transporter substrate-binding protein [Clostridium sp. CM028]MBW9149499.1 ABC transporter substrate-binding protein [Clostridium sp. CM028]WLC62148.1 ABC transporter substrate-binding protein [Clostridium sp. CM028]
MKKIFLTLMLVLIMSISIIGCSNNQKKDTSSQSLKTLTIGVMPDLDSLPLIIAEHNGYFKQEGFQVKLEHFKSASDRDTALQTGKIHGAISDMLSVVFFNDNNFDVKITSKTEGSFKLISGKNSNISKIEQADGKSIGISKNTIIEYLTDRIIESSNIDVNSQKKVAIPKIPTRLEMLTNGKLDMATLPEPLASTAISAGGKILSSSDKLGINPGVMLFTKDAVSSKSEEIKSFYRAYNKAVEYLNKEKPESYIDFVIKEAGFPDTIKSTLTIPNYSKASMPPEKELQEVMTWLKAKKLTTNNYKLQDLSNSSFIK